MLIWPFLKHGVAALTLVFWGATLLDYMMGRCVEVVEWRLDAAVGLMEETHTLGEAAEDLARGPVAWLHRAVSRLPLPLSLGLPALLHHSEACPHPDLSLFMSLPFFLRRLSTLEEYNACLRQYLKKTQEERTVVYFGVWVFKVMVLLGAVAVVMVASWVFVEVLRVLSDFRVDARCNHAGLWDRLAALTQKLNPFYTSLMKKGQDISPSSSSYLPVLSRSFFSNHPNPSSSSYASTARLSPFFGPFSPTPATPSPKVPRQEVCTTALGRARVKLFRALLTLGWELLP